MLAEMASSIRTYPPNIECEVIVVDNASDDFDANFFNEEFPWVRLILNRENAGYARGNNQAFEIASGDYVLLLNPDTQVTKGAINTLVEFMEAHPEAAAAGGRLVRPDGGLEKSVRSFPYPGPVAWEFLGLAKLFPKSRTFAAYRMGYFGYDEVAEVDQPMGSCLIVSQRALEEVGPFDEQFPIFFNEVDWLFRAKEKGWSVYFVPDATVIHHGAGSTRQVKRRKMARESHDSLIKFYHKHFKGRISAPIYYITLICIHVSRRLRG
jgi:hypothetical protein